MGPTALPEQAPWTKRIGQASDLPVPGPVLGPYPIRELTQVSRSAWVAWLKALWAAPGQLSRRRQTRLIAGVRAAAAHWRGLPGTDRQQALAGLRGQLAVHGFQDEALVAATGACVAEIESRLQWQLHDTQLVAAMAMLGGRLVEMATGEGKSVTVVLAAAVAGMAGVPVHVMTSNDYLARRDAHQWRPIYECMGLSVASVMSSSTTPERQAAYQHEIVYVTARQVAFDHLRDRAARVSGQGPPVVLRGLCMAIVDEADSILIDEACTPLLLAQALPGRQVEQSLRTTLFLAGKLCLGVHFERQGVDGVALLAEGRAELARLCASMSGPWRLRRYREDQAHLGLTALHALNRDVHYLVKDGEVHIIDGTTGRLAIGRAWSRGLHQMVCLKERVPLPPQTETLTQATYQTFFPRYHRLCGLSGTLWEERAELLATYGLPVVRAPSRFTSLRLDLGTRVMPDAAAQWLEVAARAAAVAAQGRAVLVGTDSVADSEALSRVLSEAGVAHATLNARHDGVEGEAERAVISAAGLPGTITVATHMAGRGTDIHVHPQVLARGGLHVINTHLNTSRRIDRQLQGRCARQGQPGSHERILSWGNATLRPWMARPWFAWLARGDWWVRRDALVRYGCAWVQHRAGLSARWQRWGMLQMEVSMRRQLALSGRDDWA